MSARGTALVVGASSEIGRAVAATADVRFVVDFPDRGCPVEVQVQPQRTP
jgi:hypothetical protein